MINILIKIPRAPVQGEAKDKGSNANYLIILIMISLHLDFAYHLGEDLQAYHKKIHNNSYFLEDKKCLAKLIRVVRVCTLSV